MTVRRARGLGAPVVVLACVGAVLALVVATAVAVVIVVTGRDGADRAGTATTTAAPTTPDGTDRTLASLAGRPLARAESEVLVVLDPHPDGVNVTEVERAGPADTLDGGTGPRASRFVRLDPTSVIDVTWVPWARDPDPGAAATWRSPTSSGAVLAGTADADLARTLAQEAARSGRPGPPPGYVEVPSLDPGARSLHVELGPGRSISVWPTAVDPTQVALLASLGDGSLRQGIAGSDPIEVCTMATGRRVEAVTGWLRGDTLLLPLAGALVTVRDASGDAEALLDLAARIRPAAEEEFRRWTGSFARSGAATATRLVARGTTADGRAWRAMSRVRDGLATASVRFDLREIALAAPGDAVSDGGVFVGLASTAGRIEATVDGRAVTVQAVPSGGRAVVVATDLPPRGVLSIRTPLQQWRIDLATATIVGPGRSGS
jgi:hypothetical protein